MTTEPNPFKALLGSVQARLHDEDPVVFHGDGGPGDCARCAPPAPSCAGCAGCGGPDCAQHPDQSGPDPETTRTSPDDLGQHTADQGGHDSDRIRKRVLAAMNGDVCLCGADCCPPAEQLLADYDATVNARHASEYKRVVLMLRASRELLATTQAAASERVALLEETRDILEAAGDTGARGDDWPQIAPAVQRLVNRAETAEAALARVRELHHPASYPNPDTSTGEPIVYCVGCDEGDGSHPCPTVTALTPPADQPDGDGQ